MKRTPEVFVTSPIVYAVGDTYQIMVPVKAPCVMWVKIGEKCYYDDSNGILRSACSTHRMTVPMTELDSVGQYTVCWRVVMERKPYFTEPGDEEHYTSVFRPVRKSPICIYHIADAHNRVELPVAAGTFFGDHLDLLILNGDIPNDSGAVENFRNIHEIASQLTCGEIPVIFSRGNHDMRGIFAEKIEEHTPTDCGRSYYTFRLGQLWGMVLDCAEDKPDNNPEYGFMNCCEDFRRRETEFIRRVIDNSINEYAAEGVTNRLVICHNPFSETSRPPFDIEIELYKEWCELLNEFVKPQLILCGHMHQAYVTRPGDEKDHKGQPCPVFVASLPKKESFAGGAVELYPDHALLRVTDNEKSILLEDTVSF